MELLRRLFPGRERFSAEEIEVASRVVSADAPAGRCGRLPWEYVPVGGRVRIGGRTYECVRAGATILPSQACCGCALKSARVQCLKYQCSPFDRRDGRFTWFREVKDGGECR